MTLQKQYFTAKQFHIATAIFHVLIGKKIANQNISPQYGGVKVSTGILRYGKRVEPGNLYKGLNLKLNANENVAMAA